MRINSLPSTLLWINKDIGGLRLTGIYDGSVLSFAAMREIFTGATAGLQYNSQNDLPAYAISYIPLHTENILTQAGLQYDPTAKSYYLSTELRFRLNQKIDLTMAGGISMSSDNSPLKNAGLQLSYENIRLSTNYDGSRFLISSQVYLGKYLPDIGIAIANDGKISGFIGIACLL